jgi:HK97 family phage portal protein
MENMDYRQLVDSQNFLDNYVGYTYRAVQVKAQTCAAMPVKLYRQTTSTNVEELNSDNSDLLRDLDHFNDEQTLYDARELIHIHLGLTGMAFVYIVEGVRTKEFYILDDPSRMSLETDNAGLPKIYRYTDSSGRIVDIPKDKLLVFKTANPQNWLRGYSPLEATKYQHNAYEFGSIHTMNLFGNQGKMQGILSFMNISKEERKRVERTLREKYTGKKNAGKIMVSGFKPDWLPIASNSSEMQMFDGMNLLRRDILSMHGVPEALVVSDAKYSNMQEAQRIFAEYTIQPLLKKEESIYNEQLIPRYYQTSQLEQKKLFFKFDSPIKQDKQADTERAVKAYAGGILTLNEARDILGREPLETGNSLGKKKIKSLDNIKIRAEKNLVQQEEAMAETVKQYFDQQGARVEASVRTKSLGLDFDTEAEKEITKDFFQATFLSTANFFNDEINTLLDVFERLPESAREQLQERLDKFAGEIVDTTKGDIFRVLEQAIENDLGISDTVGKLRELFDNYTRPADSRLTTIVRTETANISNMVSFDRYKDNENISGYEWLATGGQGSRTQHNALDGTTIPKNGFFELDGVEFKRPHDPALPASQVINCRCQLLPVFDLGND